MKSVSYIRRKFYLTEVKLNELPPEADRRANIVVGFAGETAEEQAAGMYYALIAVLPAWTHSPKYVRA